MLSLLILSEAFQIVKGMPRRISGARPDAAKTKNKKNKFGDRREIILAAKQIQSGEHSIETLHCLIFDFSERSKDSASLGR